MTRRSIWLNPSPILSNAEIKSAVIVPPEPSDPFSSIRLEFTPEGESAIRAATRANIGGRIAIVFDGEVILAVTVESEIGRLCTIDGHWTETEALGIARRITGSSSDQPQIAAPAKGK